MRFAVPWILCAVALAGCDKAPVVDEKDASAAEVARKVRDAGGQQSFVRPGLWESKVTIEQLDMPGVPAEMAERMKTMMAQNQPHDFQTCLTAKDVKRPKEDFFAGKDNQCRYDHFTMGNGKIDAAMRCGGKDGSQVMRMAGTYSPDSYQVLTSMKVETGRSDGAGDMSMRMRVEARRVGACSGKEA